MASTGTGGSTSSAEEARPATVADVQRIVAEAQKETQRGLEHVLKVMSEQLMSLSAEHQAVVRTTTELPGRPAATRASRTKVGNVNASDQPAALTVRFSEEVDSAAGLAVQGSSPEVVAACSGSEATESWSTLNAKEQQQQQQQQQLAKEDKRWNIMKALGFNNPDKVTRHRTPVSLRAFKRRQQQRNFVERFVRSPLFEILCGIAVFANAVFIGIHANLRATSPTAFCEESWLHVFFVFKVFFALEMVVRLAVGKLEFFCGRDRSWNLFDLSIVLAGVLEDIMSYTLESGTCSTGDVQRGLTVVRIIRILRLVRMIRVLRSMAMFHEFRVMASSILSCLLPLLSACSLLIFVHWIFAVYFVHLYADHVQDQVAKYGEVERDNIKDTDLHSHFGSLWLTMYTLFRSVTGGMDWTAAADSMFTATGLHHTTFVYIFYISLTSFAVLNVVTGLFVETATKKALQDREVVIQAQLDKKTSFMEEALSTFQEADSDGSGMVSFEEIEEHISDVRVQAFFQSIELDMAQAGRLFRLMDVDGNGQIDAQEFVSGCLELRGAAKTLDIAALLHELRRTAVFWSKGMDHLYQQMGELSKGLGKRPEDNWSV